MATEWQWDDTLFAGTAQYYRRGRLPYAPGLAAVLRIGVRDRSPQQPEFSHADEPAETGRGAHICLAVADSVEISATADGKTVSALFSLARLNSG